MSPWLCAVGLWAGPGPHAPPADDPPVDARGYPVLDYAESPPEPTSEVEWAEQAPGSPNLEYGEASDEGPQIERAPGVDRPGPDPQAIEREGPSTLTAEHRAPARTGSPQRFALELKFGPYVPAVDRHYEGDGLGPYANIYGPTDDTGVATGQPRPGLFSAVAFDWQFAKLAGPFSIGVSLGFFRDSARAIVAEPEPDAGSIRSPADKTGFFVLPLALLGGYRFELLADRFRVPLVPYAKGGLAYGLWWSTDGNGDVSRNEAGKKGRGGSVGFQVQGGLMLRLDFIERAAAATLDRVTGINHTYVFGEYQLARLDGFGTGRRMDVGDGTWLVGLAMEF
jgi:hypothetical protein